MAQQDEATGIRNAPRLRLSMIGLLTRIVPSALQGNQTDFVRAACVTLLPPLYVLGMWLSFQGYPAQALPPPYILVFYSSFPIIMRLFHSYRIPAWLFCANQTLAAVMILRRAHPDFIYGTTIVFIPYVAFTMIGPRTGFAFGSVSVLLLILAHARLFPFNYTPPITTAEYLAFKTGLVKRSFVRNFVMLGLIHALTLAVRRTVELRQTEMIENAHRVFAGVVCAALILPLFLLLLMFRGMFMCVFVGCVSVAAAGRLHGTRSGTLGHRHTLSHSHSFTHTQSFIHTHHVTCCLSARCPALSLCVPRNRHCPPPSVFMLCEL